MRQLLTAAVIALSLAGILATVAVQHREPRPYASPPSSSMSAERLQPWVTLGSGFYEEPLPF